ncbi:MAG: haloalkane dehalogenase, partial [Solirubrobacteraceae bacterium]
GFFIETVLPRSIMRTLGREEMAAYRRPFPDASSRRPTLTFARELPIEGEPADVVETVERYGAWLASSALPKLFISAEPGALLIGRARDRCRSWPNQIETGVKGIHFVQEDAPHEIGAAVREFVRSLPDIR